MNVRPLLTKCFQPRKLVHVETLMSRGPGRIQRKIVDLIAANPDGAWTKAGLCQHVYGLVEKRHRVAVIRASERMELPPLWKVCVLGPQGGELCLYNAEP